MSAINANEIYPEIALLPHERPRYMAQLTHALSMGGVALAILSVLVAVFVAINYLNQPFVGLFTNRALEVQDFASFSDEAWPGLDLGIEAGDQITGANGESFDSQENAYQEFHDILATKNEGENVLITVNRASDRGIATAESCNLRSDNRTIFCQTQVTLGTLPFVDFIGYFGIGLLTSLVALGISILVLLRRLSQSPARFFAPMGAAIATLQIGTFNLLTTHSPVLVFFWIFAGCMLSGLMVSFSMVFPSKIALSERIPSLRYAPLIIGLILSVIIFGFYENEQDNVLLVPLALIGIGVVAMILIMLWRRQYTTSPIFREQASYVVVGSVFGIFPTVAWLVLHLVQDSVPIWSIPLVQILALLFLASVAYAILQERLLESDRLIPTTVVYTILGVILIFAYVVVVVGLSWIGVKSIDANDPTLIAFIVLVISLGFVPIRTRLQDAIDEYGFRKRRHYQRRLENLLNDLTNAINVNDVDRAVRAELNEVLAPLDVVLFVRDKESQVFRAYENAETGRPTTDVTFSFKSGLAQYFETEASMLYLEQGTPLPPKVIQNRAQLAVLNCPIIVRLKGQRQLNGFIAIGPQRNGISYTYDDLQFAERVADQAALALERTQIVEDLEHRFRVQDVLSQVSRALSYAIDFETLMELIYAQTSRVIETDVFYIAIVERNANLMRYGFYVEGDERLEHIEGRRWQMGTDLLSEIARTQQLIQTDDYMVTARQRDPNAEIVHPNVHAWMGTPLTTDTASDTLGVMAVGTTDPAIRYSDEQIQLFLDIASIAASAINKTQLFEATRARTQQLEVLNAISSQLSTEIADVDRLLDLITRSAMEILQCEAGSLLLKDEHTEDLVFRVALGPGAQELIGQHIPKDRPSLANEALRKADSIIVNDTRTDNRWHGEVLRDSSDPEDTVSETFRSRAILTTPLLAQGESIGVLQIINKVDGSPFASEDATLLTTFAAQAAVAIQNARLYALQDERLIQRVTELEGLAAIDQSLNQNLELTSVVNITLDWAIRQAGGKAGAVAVILRDDPEDMVLLASQGYPDEALFSSTALGERFSTKEGVWSRVIRTGTPSFNRHLHTDPDYIETYPGAVSQIIVPVTSANEVTGILLVESDNETDLTLLGMEYLTRLADHASPAITNAQLFDQLRYQQRATSEFVSFIAHELKNPMTSLKGYANLLMRGVIGPLNEQQANFLDIIYNNVNRLETLINDLKDVQDQEIGKLPLTMSTVDFAQVVRESLRTLQQGFDRKEQTVDLVMDENLPTVWGDQQRLVQVMINFMTNANKYTPIGGQVSVIAEPAVNIWDTEGVRRVLHIQVKDTGIGISEEDLKKIFKEKYFRTNNAKATDEPGTGLGMVLTRGLILQHGGQVWVESVLGEGSTFHFTIPLADEIIREAM